MSTRSRRHRASLASGTAGGKHLICRTNTFKRSCGVRLDAGVRMIDKPFTYADLAAKVREALDNPS